MQTEKQMEMELLIQTLGIDTGKLLELIKPSELLDDIRIL